MPLHRIVFTLLALPLLGTPLAAQAGPAPRYSIAVLQPPPGSSFIDAYDLNDAGQVAGMVGRVDEHYRVSESAYLLSNGNGTKIGAAYTDGSTASAINRSGQEVGYWGAGYTEVGSHAFLYSDGNLTELGTLGGANSRARGINDAGQVVGESSLAGEDESHAFLYSNGQMRDLGTLGGAHSSANRINNAGQVVGYSSAGQYSHAFLYTDGVMADLGMLAGPQRSSWANDINEAGEVVGSSGSWEDQRAFLYSGGLMIDLGAMLPGMGSEANGINGRGQVVGDAVYWGQPLGLCAFLYSDGKMTYLNSLVDPASGWLIEKAYAINDNGQILALGYNKDLGVQPMLLNPLATVPEPPTAFMLLGGLGLMARRKRSSPRNAG